MKSLYWLPATALVLMLVLFSPAAQAQFSAEENEVLETLETQVGHFLAGRFDENETYMHPRAVFWGAYSPVPEPRLEEAPRLQEIVRANSLEEILGSYMVPLTVEVVGNTAILNVYLHVLVKPTPESEPVNRQILLHNTWVKEEGRWLLLATYNTPPEG